jgi:hypothetical protein
MANLLDQASIVLTPTAYDNGKVLCVKPSDGSGDFDFSRNSAATRVNAQGLVEDVQIISGNKITNGDFSNGSTGWNIEATWTIIGGVANGNGANGTNEELVQNNSLTAGKTYIMTYEVKNYVSGSVKIRKPNGTTRLANGVYTEILLANSLAIIFRGTNFNGSITNIIAKEITNDTNLPRINYEGFSFDGSGNIIPDSGCGHWLFEPQSTNLYLNSEPITNEGSTSGITYESFSWSLGFSNCVRYGDNSQIRFRYGASVSASTEYTLSMFVIMDDLSEPVIGDRYSGTDFTFVIGGSIFNNANPNVNMGNNIYRVSVKGTTSASPNTGNSGIIKFTEQSSTGFRVVGYQLEEQSYATSYIPTDGTSVTRNQDVCTGGGSAASINSTEGVLYAEIAALANDNTIRAISLGVIGDNSQTISIRFRNASNTIGLFMKPLSPSNLNTSTSAFNILNFNKIALKYKSGEIALWINGSEVFTSTNTLNISGLNKLDFEVIGGSSFFGKTKCLAVWKEALTDTELQELTTI